jgi:8-oxo-dGTP pyrophosphatase MutT (NUDIX family)
MSLGRGQQLIQCANCSQLGHTSKNCLQPITSYGVLVFRIKSGPVTEQVLLAGVPGTLESAHQQIEYFMIQRRDSIGFVEIMRGKYKLNDLDYIQQQIAGTTQKERTALLSQPFESLWEALWGAPQHGSHSYRHEKEAARAKLEQLRSGSPSTLSKLINSAPPAWDTPEWGFPKGRKELNESEYACAMREMWEETDLKESDLVPLRGIDPMVESFQGSNNVKYVHKYFLAYAPAGVGERPYAEVAAGNPHVQREIGDLAWKSFADAVRLIRPEAKEKREMLLRVHTLLRNYALFYPRLNNPPSG